mmetsp:Transcript_60351/g.136002  ORF Transcript_60351/g.136002 Transcript_60351/m.136002 type:complete len:297 (+) Transcript_60351:96-986(+)
MDSVSSDRLRDGTATMSASSSQPAKPAEAVDERWATPEGALKSELVAACHEAARSQSSRLPRSASETRMARNRMPTNALEHLLRRGAPVSEVAEQAALRLVERWVRLLLRNHVPRAKLPVVVSDLVHGPEAEVATDPLGRALRRLVPQTQTAAVSGWKFLDDMLEIIDFESDFDRTSYIHSPPPDKSQRLALCCGRQPRVLPVGKSTTSFGKSTFLSSEGSRTTTSLCGREDQASTYMSLRPAAAVRPHEVPGPAHYATAHKVSSIQTGRRGVFPPVGRPRPVCMVTSLSTQERFF